MHACREVDGYNPYVEFQNGTFIPAQSAKFCSQDAQATQTSMLTDLLLLQLPSLLLVPTLLLLLLLLLLLVVLLLLLLPPRWLMYVSFSMTATEQSSWMQSALTEYTCVMLHLHL